MNMIFFIGILRHTVDAPKNGAKSPESKRNLNPGFVAQGPQQFQELTGFETGTDRVLHVLND